MMKIVAAALMLSSCFAFVDTASAFAWVPKTSAEERAGFVAAARAAGETELADRIAALDDAAWIDPAIRASEAMLAATADLDAFDPKRRTAFQLLDYPLHVNNYDKKASPEVRSAFERAATDYVKRAIARVREEVRTAKVEPDSLRIWHVYNMAYVLKGAQHTVLIDFTPYPYSETFASWTDSDWDAFADIGDILVITHPHRDHTSYPLMNRMLERGKTLVLPCAMTNRYDASQVYLPGKNIVVLDTDHAAPVDVCGVKFRNFHGFQGNVPCNSYNIEIDGVTVTDNGDNSDINKDACQMDCPPADVIIAATWNRPMFFVKSCMLARGFRRDRAVFLPSHDNELMHSVPHRESYREMYEADRRLGAPDFIWPRVKPLALGESMTWIRSRE